MNKNENLATIFEQLSGIQNLYNTATKKVDEEDLITVVLDAAPKDYQLLLTGEQWQMGNLLTLDDLATAMNQRWRQIGSSKSSDDEDEDQSELGLMAFHGICFECGEKGHKAHGCKNKGNEQYKQFKGTCNNCGKHGHMAVNCLSFNICGKFGHKTVDCWDKEENKHKRPANYRTGSERANVTAESSDRRVDFLLCGMTSPSNAELLNDPNV